MKRSDAGRQEAAAVSAEPVARVVAVVLPMVVMLALGLWRLDRGGMWRDEAATYQVARRSVPQIWHLLHHVDAVHGLYYLFMHLVLVPAPGEVALRLPSVVGATATAGLVAALGIRLGNPRVGLWAGLLYAVTPLAGHFAQEGRSYALVEAGATGATLLLVRALRGGRGWWAYGVTVAVTCLLHEFAVLLLLAHGATLALTRTPWRVWWRWGVAAGAAVLVLAPLALVSRRQSAQVAWLAVPNRESVDDLVHAFLGQAQLVFVPYLFLIALALWRPFARRGEVTLVAVALPLLLVPPTVLIAVSRFRPLYDERYVLYAMAGAPLLAAAGADRLTRRVSRLPGAAAPRLVTLAGVLAVCLVLAVQFPLLREDRDPDRRPDNLAAVSAVAGRELRPGDAVLYMPSLARRSAVAYPAGFRAVRDVALKTSAIASGTLYGTEVGPRELRSRLDRLDRVWLICEPFVFRRNWHPDTSVATEETKRAVLAEDFTLRERIVRRGVTLRLYVRHRQNLSARHR
ncbi:glycosyltransferase family 39 protein [Streptomyces sp. NBC_01450]|uniref:glycosyltransferase family 39 protein n=1 Tax=Streptomyces sp. NBC_01450 TaxID=2903871 RepID=UPI002E360B42|nr:glycosyltransferase family 39 protein [Streptomyces sp. NBC_01450]